VHRALDERSFHVEKLVIQPVERRPGMRAAVTVGETLVIAPHYETLDRFSAIVDRKPVTAGIIESLKCTDKCQIFHDLPQSSFWTLGT